MSNLYSSWVRISLVIIILISISTGKADDQYKQLEVINREIASKKYGRLPNRCKDDVFNLRKYRSYILARMWRRLRFKKKIEIIKNKNSHKKCFKKIINSSNKDFDHLWDHGNRDIENNFISLCNKSLKETWPLLKYLYSKGIWEKLNLQLNKECEESLLSLKFKRNIKMIRILKRKRKYRHEADYIEDYTNCSNKFNIPLRKGKIYKKSVKLAVSLISIDDPHEGKSYRGADCLLGGHHKLKKGAIVCEQGFLSTTINKDEIFSGSFKMIINGHNGRYINQWSTYSDEEEVLFPCHGYYLYKGKLDGHDVFDEVSWREKYNPRKKRSIK